MLQPSIEGLPQDLLWSDPKYDIRGFEPNDLRECSVLFGEDVVFSTCKKLNIELIVRAHQAIFFGDFSLKNFQFENFLLYVY